MSIQMAISGEPTAVVPAALAGVFDEAGVSSDRQPAISGRAKGVALASGVKCRAYGVRTAA
jgi:type IV secretory pathway TrbL component